MNREEVSNTDTYEVSYFVIILATINALHIYICTFLLLLP